MFSIQVTIPKDFTEQAGSDGFTRMHGDNHTSSIFVTKKMMAAFDSDDLKPSLFNHRDQVQASETWERGHAATVIR